MHNKLINTLFLPIKPKTKELGITLPQSYCYLEEATWNKLRGLKRELSL